MRIDIHYKIAKRICAETKELGLHLHEKSFLFGNLFPDLIQSFFWCRHEYSASREYLKKKIEKLKKKPFLFSFQLGILTHYICDYFCYPHSRIYDKSMLQHILYELRQKTPKNFLKMSLDIKSFAIEELDKFVDCYEDIRPYFMDDEYDFQMAAHVSTGFLQAACQ